MRALPRISLSRLKRLEKARGARDGRSSVLSREGAEAIRRELLFGRDGPTFGSGPAKLEALQRIILGKGRAPELYDQARAHHRDTQDAAEAAAADTQ